MKEFTNSGNDNTENNHQLRFLESIGAIGPGGQCFIAKLDLPKDVKTPFESVLYPSADLDLAKKLKTSNDPTEVLGCY